MDFILELCIFGLTFRTMLFLIGLAYILLSFFSHDCKLRPTWTLGVTELTCFPSPPHTRIWFSRVLSASILVLWPPANSSC